jgi:acyl-CoA synthetase (AMP-forming)/AMP-acid ligase II
MSATPITTVTRLLRERAEHEGERDLYLFLGTGDHLSRLSYRATYARACAIARQLRRCGVQAGDRALLLYPPGLEFLESFFGCLCAGVIAVPQGLSRPKRPIDRLERIAGNCGPAVVLTVDAALAPLRQQLAASAMLAATPLIATDTITTSDEAPPDQPGEGEVEGDAQTIAFLQYTSGSTGDPKGVIVTHGNILHNQQLILEAFEHPLHSTVVGWLPTFHDMGLVGNVLQSLYIAGRCVLMAPAAFLQQPMRWLQTIAAYRAYTSGGPNFAYDLCVAKYRDVPDLDLSGWRLAFNGAEPIRAETIERFTRTFAPYGFRAESFYTCYGLAESTLIVAGGRAGQAPVVSTWEEHSLTTSRAQPAQTSQARKLVACGAVLGDQRLAIVDPVTTTPVGEGEIGEIWVSGSSVGRGYWADDTRTRAVFGGVLDGDAALRTGDRGFLAQGRLYVLGRDREILTLFGRKFCANAIELAAELAGAPAVGRCAAYVVAGDPFQQLLIACECDRGVARDDAATDAIAARIKAALVRAWDLSPTVVFVNPGALPRTPSGKLRRDVPWTEPVDARPGDRRAAAAGSSSRASSSWS